ncbi:MAG: phenylacetate-CoA oxygenase subunit PaaJ [Woeseia sp.]|nr:phenylacetate-CoA oxygenase subunit PaaJ [Woeseia sp.]MBT8097481.1 phenylacetate-CoA oxygenase subunit PaaJ [Woeseia sp.]NNE60889.1 phenylacetate-CoA oxygenase subunit PaaJ [Woeseia sp.]NNL53953.1 phenylacetate-CoA oxygenase subunit PaaJ [Woeseia sp.]
MPNASTTAADSFDRAWTLLAEVPDPEIPIVSVLDLGMVRGIHKEQETLVVEVAPTYSGCPATEVIELSIAQQLEANGYENVSVRRVLSPPWTTDWISDAGRKKLLAFGIAPPPHSTSLRGGFATLPVACPQCASLKTERISEFGSTPCKAAWRCTQCQEPFDHFKCI